MCRSTTLLLSDEKVVQQSISRLLTCASLGGQQKKLETKKASFPAKTDDRETLKLISQITVTTAEAPSKLEAELHAVLLESWGWDEGKLLNFGWLMSKADLSNSISRGRFLPHKRKLIRICRDSFNKCMKSFLQCSFPYMHF